MMNKGLFSFFHIKYVKSQMLCYAKQTHTEQKVICDIVNSLFTSNNRILNLLCFNLSCTYIIVMYVIIVLLK